MFHVVYGTLALAIILFALMPKPSAGIARLLRVPLVVSLCVMGMLFLPVAAMAQSVTTTTAAPPEPIQLGPFVTVWAPFINAIAQNVIGAVVAMVVTALTPFIPSFLRSYWDGQARKVLASAVQTAAGNVLAKVEGDISKKSFNIGNPLVHSMMQWVLNKGAGDEVKRLKLSPDDVAEKIVAEIGKLQAAATANPPSPAT